MNWMVRDRSFYKRLLFIAAPIALQNIISFSVGLADNIMVGRLGEVSISGVYIVNQIQSFYQMLVMGLGAAMAVLATQYWGKRDRESVIKIIGIALKFGLIISVMIFAAMFLAPQYVLSIFTNEAAVVQEAVLYARIISFTYLFFCLTNVLLAAFRCVETVRIGMILSVVTLFINVGLNYILIFGKLGFPALGIQGAAIATLTARIVETAVILIYTARVDQKLRLTVRELLIHDRTLFQDFFRYGLPVVMGDVLWGVNIATQGAIIGHLGASVISASSIANTIFSIAAVGVYGLANASSVIIGQTVGNGDVEKVKQYARTLQVIFICGGVISGLMLFLIKDYVILLYNLAPDTVRMARQFMTVLCITLVGTAYQMSVLTGIVRAGGATHFVLVNDMIFVWLIVIPSAYIAAFVLNAEPWIVFACLKCDQILKCLVAVVKVNRFKWIKVLTQGHSERQNA